MQHTIYLWLRHTVAKNIWQLVGIQRVQLARAITVAGCLRGYLGLHIASFTKKEHHLPQIHQLQHGGKKSMAASVKDHN